MPNHREMLSDRARIEREKTTWICRTGTGELLGEVEADDRGSARGLATARWPAEEERTGLDLFNRYGVERVRRRLEVRCERERWENTHHEAGHAVLARRHGLAVERIELGLRMFHTGRRYDPGSDSFARIVYGPDDPGEWGDPRRIESRILSILGGPLASLRYRACTNWVNLGGRRLSGSDREGVEGLGAVVAIRQCGCLERRRGGRPFDEAVHARCVRRYLRRVRAMAADEVEAAWDGIAAVAIELERSRLLVGADIDRVLRATIGLPTGSGRSIDRSGPATGR